MSISSDNVTVVTSFGLESIDPATILGDNLLNDLDKDGLNNKSEINTDALEKFNPGKELTAENLITLQQFSEAIDKSTIDRFSDGVLAKYKDIKVLPLKSDPRKADSDGDSYTFKDEFNDYSDSKDPTPLRCDVKISKLKNSDDFVKINNEDEYYYGGDQAWFADNPVGQSAGCGTVATANIFAYLAKQDPNKYGRLYFGDPNNISKEDFTSHMNSVYKYVKPRRIYDFGFGVWPLSRFTDGVDEYGKHNNINLINNTLEVYKTTPPNAIIDKLNHDEWKKQANNLIKGELENNNPVAVLIGFNKLLKDISIMYMDGNEGINDIERHWVTITEMVDDSIKDTCDIKVSTWGGYAFLNLNDIIDGENLYTGFVAFS